MRKLLLLSLAFSLMGGVAASSRGQSGGPYCGATVWCRNGQVLNCFGYIGYDTCSSAPGCWIMCDGNAEFCDDRPMDCPWVT
jgi:hypothetical protein